MMAHGAPKTVFIGGGGEGATAREVLRWKSVEKVPCSCFLESCVHVKGGLPENCAIWAGIFFAADRACVWWTLADWVVIHVCCCLTKLRGSSSGSGNSRSMVFAREWSTTMSNILDSGIR